MREDEAGLEEQLRTHRREVLAGWREAILSGYAPQAARLLAGAPDAFRNPIRHRIDQTTESVFDALTADSGSEALEAALDPMVRVQAVQDRRPSDALVFVLQLRGVVHRVLGASLDQAARAGLDERIDRVALAAFDVYARCRQELEEIRVREAHRRVAALLSRAGGPAPGDGPDGAVIPVRPVDLKELA